MSCARNGKKDSKDGGWQAVLIDHRPYFVSPPPGLSVLACFEGARDAAHNGSPRFQNVATALECKLQVDFLCLFRCFPRPPRLSLL
jgi:hypothetical protein